MKTKHIKLFEHFNKEKKFYHASCEDFSNFNHNVYYFSQTKKDCLHFHKNWRKCSDNKPTILYECLIDLGKNFNPKNLKDYEINSIKELYEIGVDYYFEQAGLHFIEWPDKFASELPISDFDIYFLSLESSRLVKIHRKT